MSSVAPNRLSLPRSTVPGSLRRNASHGSITSLVALSICSDKSYTAAPYRNSREPESISNIISPTHQTITCPHCAARIDIHDSFDNHHHISELQPNDTGGQEGALSHKPIVSGPAQPSAVNLDATITSLDQTLSQLGAELRDYHLRNPEALSRTASMISMSGDMGDYDASHSNRLQLMQVDGSSAHPGDQPYSALRAHMDRESIRYHLGSVAEGSDESRASDGDSERPRYQHIEFSDAASNIAASTVHGGGGGKDLLNAFSLFTDTSNLENLVGSNARLLRTLQSNINRALQYHRVLTNERDTLAQEKKEVQELKKQLQKKLKETAAVARNAERAAEKATKEKNTKKEDRSQQDSGAAKSVKFAPPKKTDDIKAAKRRSTAEESDAIFMMEEIVAPKKDGPSPARQSLDMDDASTPIVEVIWTDEDESLYNHLLNQLKKANRQWSPEQEEILEQLEPLKEKKRLSEKAKRRKSDRPGLYKTDSRMSRSSSELGSSSEKEPIKVKTRTNSFSLLNGLKRSGSKNSFKIRRSSTASTTQTESTESSEERKEKPKKRFSRILKG